MLHVIEARTQGHAITFEHEPIFVMTQLQTGTYQFICDFLVHVTFPLLERTTAGHPPPVLSALTQSNTPETALKQC